jgi:hypothetical protein
MVAGPSGSPAGRTKLTIPREAVMSPAAASVPEAPRTVTEYPAASEIASENPVTIDSGARGVSGAKLAAETTVRTGVCAAHNPAARKPSASTLPLIALMIPRVAKILFFRCPNSN